MKIESNYNITRLFVSKEITVACTTEESYFSFSMKLKTVKDFFLDEQWIKAFILLTTSNYKKFFKEGKDVSHLQFIKMVIFDLGVYKNFVEMYTLLKNKIKEIIPDIVYDATSKELKIKSHIITEDIWEYIIYLLKLSYGEKVDKPLTFETEEARKYYLAQKALEEKIARIRAKNRNQEDSIIKTMLSIVYAFPSFTIDYLYDQTMAQIQWLAKYAAKSVSYEVNAKAFAAGNMKKGQKLDFFIK